MKAFLSEYGLIIVAVLVIIVFIAFAAVFGGQIKDAISNVVQHLFEQTNMGGLEQAAAPPIEYLK